MNELKLTRQMQKIFPSCTSGLIYSTLRCRVPLTSLFSGSGTGPLEHPGRGITPVTDHTSGRGGLLQMLGKDEGACTYCCVDLAVVCGQAVPLVEVGEGLGGTPGLQVAGHPDGRPHLAAVQGRTGTQAQQGAVTFGLQGARGKKSRM